MNFALVQNIFPATIFSMLEVAQKNKKEITLDEFAEMMMREFVFTRKTLGDKIDRLEVRMDRVEVRLDRLEERFTVLEKRVGVIEKRLTVIETTLITTMATKDDIVRLDKRFDHLEKKFDRIENVVLADHSIRITRLERLKTA